MRLQYNNYNCYKLLRQTKASKLTLEVLRNKEIGKCVNDNYTSGQTEKGPCVKMSLSDLGRVPLGLLMDEFASASSLFTLVFIPQVIFC